MRVSDVMTREVRVASPTQTLREVAQIMADIDAGVVPVGDNDRLVGMITDRDIAVRGVAAGKGPDAQVQEIMSSQVLYCYEDEDTDDVAENMADVRVRRLPVVNRDKRLVGILSLGDLAGSEEARTVGKAVEGISKPGGPHSQ